MERGTALWRRGGYDIEEKPRMRDGGAARSVNSNVLPVWPEQRTGHSEARE